MGTPIQCSNTSTRIGRGRGGDGKETKRREGQMAPGNGADLQSKMLYTVLT